MTSILKSYQELTKDELYLILQLRQEVFIVEQDCPYLDADNRDQKSWHLMIFTAGDELAGYARLLPIDISYKKYTSIGRILTNNKFRGQGYGKTLMKIAIEILLKKSSNTPIKISAQTYLTKYYQSFGFQTIGEEYLEDNIPHIEMILGHNNLHQKP